MGKSTVSVATVRQPAKRVEASLLNVQALLLQVEEALEKLIRVQNLIADDPRLSAHKVLHDRMGKNVRALQMPLRQIELARAEIGVATALTEGLLYLAEDGAAYQVEED